MTRGERSPALLENVTIMCRADFDGNQSVGLCSSSRFAAIQQIRTGPAHGVLDNVSDEGGEDDGDEERKIGDFVLGS